MVASPIQTFNNKLQKYSDKLVSNDYLEFRKNFLRGARVVLNVYAFYRMPVLTSLGIASGFVLRNAFVVSAKLAKMGLPSKLSKEVEKLDKTAEIIDNIFQNQDFKLVYTSAVLTLSIVISKIFLFPEILTFGMQVDKDLKKAYSGSLQNGSLGGSY